MISFRYMKEKIKTICLILVTISIIIFLGFQVWSISEKQRYYKIEECKYRSGVSWNWNSDRCEIQEPASPEQLKAGRDKLDEIIKQGLKK